MTTPTISKVPDLFRAFADPTRLRILNVLQEGEMCVCDLCEILDLPQPTASRHLAYLRRVGLVTVRQQGKWKYYASTEYSQGLEHTLLCCLRTCVREIDVLRDDLDRLSKTDLGTRCGE